MRKIFVLIFLLFMASAVLAVDLPIGVQKLIEHERGIALSITFLAAFLGGMISFTSPCGFVLFPVFFSYVFQERKKALVMTSLFSFGLLIGFTIVGVIAGVLGNFFNAYKETFALVAGLMMIAFGVMLFLNKGFGFSAPKLERRTPLGLFLFGFLFSFAWSPCISPILGGVFLLAGLSGSVIKGMILLFFFGLGVVVPLLVLSYVSDRFDWSQKVQGKQREFSVFGKKVITNMYNIVGGFFLVSIGSITLLFKGTQFFQIYIPQVLPWSMNVWAMLNSAFLRGFFVSKFANMLGVVLGGIVLIILFLNIKKLMRK